MKEKRKKKLGKKKRGRKPKNVEEDEDYDEHSTIQIPQQPFRK